MLPLRRFVPLCAGSPVAQLCTLWFERKLVVRVTAWGLQWRSWLVLGAPLGQSIYSNIDDLFRCGDFCCAVRHSDLFNTGVMVFKPSRETYKDMMARVNELGSYTGGDQGFLNAYFRGAAEGPLFVAST